ESRFLASLGLMEILKLPGADANDGLGRDFQTLLWVDLPNVIHPGMGVLEVEDAPGKGTRDHPVKSPADGDAGTVLGILDGVGVAHGVVAQGAIAIIPFIPELGAQIVIDDFLSDFSATEHELSERREATSGHRGPAETAAVEQRIRTDIDFGLMHDQAAADFREDLQRGADAGSAGTTAADTGATAKESFEIREGGEFDVSFLGAGMGELDALWFPRIFYEDEGLFPFSTAVIRKQHLADLVILAKKIQARFANPGRTKSHEIGKGPAGIQKAASQDEYDAIVGAVLEPHDEVAVRGIFGQHGAKAESGSVHQGDKAGGCVQHDIANGSFTGGTNFPLCVPDGGIGHRTQHTDPVFPAIAPLDGAVPRVILPFDEAKDGAFDGMTHVRSHEGITIAPTAKFGDGLCVVSEPVAIEGVARTGFGGDVESVHDTGVEKGLTESGLPTKARLVILVRFLVLRIETDVGGIGILGLFVGRECNRLRKRVASFDVGRGNDWRKRNKPSAIDGLKELRLCVKDISRARGDIQGFLRNKGRAERATGQNEKTYKNPTCFCQN